MFSRFVLTDNQLLSVYLVGVVGFEPTTLGLKVRYSSQLSYTPGAVSELNARSHLIYYSE